MSDAPLSPTGGPGLAPTISTLFDEPLPQRRKSLIIADGSYPSIDWVMTDPVTGLVLDLTSYINLTTSLVPCAVKLIEATWQGNPFTVDATCPTPATGMIVAPLDVSVLGGPGIFTLQIAVLDTAGRPAAINTAYLIVERSLFGNFHGLGPLQLDEIRLHLRDNSADENRLLDTRQFDDAEIARVLVSIVEYWNNALPPISPFTTQNFPYRDLWLQGATARLQMMVAEWYRKNRLDNSTGGISLSDLNKADEYDRRGSEGWASFTKAVQSLKVGINMEAAYGGISSPYARLGRCGW